MNANVGQIECWSETGDLQYNWCFFETRIFNWNNLNRDLTSTFCVVDCFSSIFFFPIREPVLATTWGLPNQASFAVELCSNQTQNPFASRLQQFRAPAHSYHPIVGRQWIGGCRSWHLLQKSSEKLEKRSCKQTLATWSVRQSDQKHVYIHVLYISYIICTYIIYRKRKEGFLASRL